nr:tripartite tricarboxylate transporter TctB family protein [Halomonas zhangzhouensis]
MGFSCLVLLFGLFVAYLSTRLSMGSMSRIGPGFFPLIIGVVMAVLGLVSFFDRPEACHEDKFNFRGLVMVGMAIFVFAILIERLGLFPAIVAMVFLCNMGGKNYLSVMSLLVTIFFLNLVGYLLFIRLLRLPLELFSTGILG